MLTETLKNDKSNPHEVALGLLQFIQHELPAGGSQAEDRFIHLFQLICDRVFGKMLDSKDQYRHASDGWMSLASAPWLARSSNTGKEPYNLGATSVRSSDPSFRSSGSIPYGAINRGSSIYAALERDPVALFLGTNASMQNKDEGQTTFIDAISKESSNRPSLSFPFPLHAFPENLCEAWLALLEASVNQVPVSPEKCSCNMRELLTKLGLPPLQQHHLVTFRQSRVQKKQSAVPLMQMSPRGFPASSPKTALASAHDSKPAEPLVRFGMLESYLFLFFRFPLYPVVKSSSATSTMTSSVGVNVHRVPLSRSSVSRRPSETYGEALYNFLFSCYLRHFLQYERFELSRESELFLRVLISLWFESQGIPQTTSTVVARVRAHVASLNLNSSYDLIFVKYNPPYLQIQKGILSLVKHLILDPSVEVLDPRRYSLPKPMQVLQEAFSNYVRTSFRHAEIHKTDSPFYTALEAWLMWLEPWNVRRTVGRNNSTKRATQILQPRKDDAESKFSKMWENYVSANLHLYTVPLAIFLRRARELDFSSNNFDKSLRTVRRVFRVFSNDLVNCLNGLLQEPTTGIVQSHVENLGVHAPPNADHLSLSSCQEDTKILLEEVQLQHNKKKKEHLLFGNNIVSHLFAPHIALEENKINWLLERARVMVQLPNDYQIDSRPAASRNFDTNVASDLLIDADGKLTDDGFCKIIQGQTKCDPMDATYRGDEMKSRLRQGEVGILRDLFVNLSEWITKKVGLKVNLRFLADWRNLASVIALLSFVIFIAVLVF